MDSTAWFVHQTEQCGIRYKVYDVGAAIVTLNVKSRQTGEVL